LVLFSSFSFPFFSLLTKQTNNKDNVSEWNEEDVLNYARNVASSWQRSEVFLKKIKGLDLTGDILCTVTEEELKDAGISLGHARKFSLKLKEDFPTMFKSIFHFSFFHLPTNDV